MVGGTNWKVMDGRLAGKCSKTQGRYSRLDCTPPKRTNDDHGAAEMGRERGEVVMTSERQCCVKNDAW